jgi:hypothetical protein
MFITFDGSTATNQYLSPHASHLILNHSSVVDQLLLAEHEEKPYEHYPIGWTQSDGRSLLGSLRLKGNNWKKDVWESNFHANQAQVDLFNLLLQSQQDSSLPVSIVDYWKSAPVTRQIWIEVDRQYLTTVATNQWYRLQFQCLEV